jgi:hypothetical protein
MPGYLGRIASERDSTATRDQRDRPRSAQVGEVEIEDVVGAKRRMRHTFRPVQQICAAQKQLVDIADKLLLAEA